MTDYNAEENRKAYMISYYPYFIAPASYVAKICLKQNLLASDGKWIFFACGPCPELLGIARILPPPLSVITFDLEKNWFPYQQITNKFCRDFGLKSRLKFWYNFEIGNSLPTGIKFFTRIEFRIANIFFMQNYLSHMLPTDENINKFLAWFSAWVGEAKDGACFIFIDLNYGSTTTVFNMLGEKNFLQQNGLKIVDAHIPAFGNPLEIHHGDTTAAIGEKIFTGEYGLYKRFLTKFYFVVLKKSDDDELEGAC